MVGLYGISGATSLCETGEEVKGQALIEKALFKGSIRIPHRYSPQQNVGF